MTKSLVERLDAISDRLTRLHAEIEREALCTEDPRGPANLSDIAQCVQDCIDQLDTLRDRLSDVTVSFATFVSEVRDDLR